MKVRQELTLFWEKPPCFSYGNDAVLMLIGRNLHYKSSEVSIQTKSIPASQSFKGWATKCTTVECSIMQGKITRLGVTLECLNFIVKFDCINFSFKFYLLPQKLHNWNPYQPHSNLLWAYRSNKRCSTCNRFSTLVSFYLCGQMRHVDTVCCHL